MLTVGLSVAAAPAVGQSADAADADAADVPGREGTSPPVELSLNTAGRYTFESDFDGKEGHAAVTRVGGDLSVSAALSERWRLGLSVGYAFSEYEFTDLDLAVPGVSTDDPIDGLHTTSFGVSATYAINQEWSVTTAGGVRWDFESGADAWDAVTGSIGASANWRFSDRLILGLGAGVGTRIEDDPLAFPFFFLRWELTDKLTLETRRIGFLDERAGVVATYEICPMASVFVSAAYETREFRLADGDPALEDGVLRDSRVPVALGLEWKPAEGLVIALEGGIVAWEEYEFLDSSGGEITDVEGDLTAFVGGSIQYTF